mmetsp:Transcript_28081/g.81175  ORF Transcript_28081/g.81175 Transcript_28081/m.81175 type:complete len:318 (-) Transcript_28081:281-1234(-)
MEILLATIVMATVIPMVVDLTRRLHHLLMILERYQTKERRNSRATRVPATKSKKEIMPYLVLFKGPRELVNMREIGWRKPKPKHLPSPLNPLKNSHQENFFVTFVASHQLTASCAIKHAADAECLFMKLATALSLSMDPHGNVMVVGRLGRRYAAVQAKESSRVWSNIIVQGSASYVPSHLELTRCTLYMTEMDQMEDKSYYRPQTECQGAWRGFIVFAPSLSIRLRQQAVVFMLVTTMVSTSTRMARSTERTKLCLLRTISSSAVQSIQTTTILFEVCKLHTKLMNCVWTASFPLEAAAAYQSSAAQETKTSTKAI